MTRRRLLTLLLASMLGLVLPEAALATVEGGTVLVGRGVETSPQGETILAGMAKSDVVAALGKPIFTTKYGYMQYGETGGTFDVYLNQRSKRVELIIVSGESFCTRSGICMLKRGGLGALEAKFGAALKREVAPDGVHYLVRGHFAGKRATTVFDCIGDRPSAQIVSISLAWG